VTNDRRRPPDRRKSPLVTYTVGYMKYTAQASFDAKGELLEMFLNCGIEGSSANIVARECAVILSIALQCETPLDSITKALPLLSNGLPAGPVGRALYLFAHPEISPDDLETMCHENGHTNVVELDPAPKRE
jgi:hypothetical protein